MKNHQLMKAILKWGVVVVVMAIVLGAKEVVSIIVELDVIKIVVGNAQVAQEVVFKDVHKI